LPRKEVGNRGNSERMQAVVLRNRSKNRKWMERSHEDLLSPKSKFDDFWMLIQDKRDRETSWRRCLWGYGGTCLDKESSLQHMWLCWTFSK
jgi:hypothetical protein